MDNLKSKFIVIENENTNEKFIYISKCYFHKELLERINDRNKDNFKCIGGGEFKIDNFNTENKSLNLFGTSNDFGNYPFNICLEIIKNKKIFDTPFLYPNNITSKNIFIINITKYGNYFNTEKIEKFKYDTK